MGRWKIWKRWLLDSGGLPYKEGDQEYDVKVKTRQTQIKEWHCDYPSSTHDPSEYVVAVFYAIRENMGIEAKTKKEIKITYIPEEEALWKKSKRLFPIGKTKAKPDAPK